MAVGVNGEVSFWWKDAGGRPAYRAPLPGPLDVDVCIVGGGYTGLWTAYYLKQAQPGLSVAILEREFAGYGSSGRNGGQLSGGMSWNRGRYLAASNEAQVVAFERALAGSVAEIRRVASEERIDADIHSTDLLTIARTPSQLQRLEADYQQSLTTGGHPMELIDGPQLASRVAIDGALGASVTHGVARVQPAKLVRGLAAAVERLGVPIYERTTVHSLAKGRVGTDRGPIKARRIVRATEGYTAGLAGYHRTWLPLNSAIVVTEPLPPEGLASIGWRNNEILLECAHLYTYIQKTRENRIAFGGRGVPYRFGSRTDHDGETQAATIAKLREGLHRLFPQTRDLRLDHAWCGVLGTPRDWCATVGLDSESGIAWAGGYVGDGISTSNLAGRTLADLVLDEPSDLTRLPWVNRRVRNWEVEPLRWLGVNAMYRLYKIADAQEAASGNTATSRLASLANRITGR
jgi:glycine/D-amino acid oxidase-like deaminating enzyme